jgi:hypothetical protein
LLSLKHIARDLLEEVRALERELGRLQGQRELEAVAESTLRESLERAPAGRR